MSKWANYLIIGAVITMLLPLVLDYFKLLNNYVFWPITSIVLISLGFVLHLINGALKKKLNSQTLLVLSSILIIVTGFSLVQMRVNHTEYLLILGIGLILIWLFLPNKRSQ